MDNHELIQEALINANSEEGSEEQRRAILATDIIEIARMTEGDNETLPPMTAAELDEFLNSEDEVLKEARGEEPVVNQLAPPPLGEPVTLEDVDAAMEERRQYLEDVDKRRNG